MSASREKKQRQSAGPDQKAVKVQQEQAARKRQTIIYSAVAAVIAVLVIALLVWRTGIFQARAAAATVGGETLSTAELSFYYGNVRSTYASYGILDSSKADDEQFYNQAENVTYRDFFLEQALEYAQQHLAMSREAVSAGHTESEIKADLDDQIDQAKSAAASNGYGYAAYLKAMYGSYMTTSVFEKLTTRYLMARLVANEKYDELYESYAQTDLEDYYKENADTLDTIEYSYLYFPVATVSTKDDDGNELAEDEVAKLQDEAKAAAKANAEEALNAVKGGASFDSQKEKYELTSAADHATAVGTGRINTAYSEQLLALDADECELVELDSGACYVISFHSRHLDEAPTRDVRHILIRAENTTDGDGKLVAPTDDAWAAAKGKMDEIQAAWDASGKNEDDFAALANEKSDDAGSNTTGGLYERSYDGQFVPEFNDWVFDSARKTGDVGLVQHEGDESSSSAYWGYHLIYYVGENEPVWMGTVRSTLASDAQDTWLHELTESLPASLSGGASYLGR